MRKIWTIARREYGAMVATKAFLLSLTMMPVLMFGGIFVAKWMSEVRGVAPKKLVIVDGTGGLLFADLRRAAEKHNAPTPGPRGDPAMETAQYLLERHPTDAVSDADRLALSKRVRNEDIKAFVEIPQEILATEADAAPTLSPVRFFAPNAMLSEERRWVEGALNEAVIARRMATMKLDAAAVKQATAPVAVAPLGLVKQTADGRIQGADEGRNLAGLFLPMGFMMLMFMVIFLSAQPLMESVMEEKAGRIAEVLLGSVNSFQLMLGKLLGNVAGSLSVVSIYALGGYAIAAYNGSTDMIPWEMVPWFVVYQMLGVLLFSSVFLAVGAAVTQAKEAQSMLLPVWLVICLPLFAWLQIVREPNGAVATWMSFFPPSTPLVMALRLASDAVIPPWQIAVSLALLVLATACGVYLAGRVFRIGILWQGKSPRFSELARWVFRG